LFIGLLVASIAVANFLSAQLMPASNLGLEFGSILAAEEKFNLWAEEDKSELGERRNEKSFVSRHRMVFKLVFNFNDVPHFAAGQTSFSLKCKIQLQVGNENLN
jgi:hypothetical protein